MTRTHGGKPGRCHQSCGGILPPARFAGCLDQRRCSLSHDLASGTPQEALDCACGLYLYLYDPKAWLTLPPPAN